MSTQGSHGELALDRFGWRDALAFARAFPRIALRRRPSLALNALARISAMDVRRVPSQRYFEASDGARLAYRTYPGNEAVHLVAIHGSACFGDQFHLMAGRLSSERTATVHTIDMRGHGLSSAGAASFGRFMADVLEFVRSLRMQNPQAQIVIAGHSAGGGLAINLARNAPTGEISGWLLLAPFTAVADPGVRPYFGGWVARFCRWKFALVVAANAVGLRRFNEVPLLWFDREACLHDPRYAREWDFTEIYGFGPGRARPDKPVISGAPVLLIAGKNDECFDAADYRRALGAIAPRAEYRILEGPGHWDVLVDGQALDACTEWLGRHFADPAAEDGRAGDYRHASFG